MAPDAPLFIGLDLGGTNIQSGVVDADGRILARDKTKTRAEEGSDKVLKRIEKAVKKLLDDVDRKPGEVAALGIGAPGAVDVSKGLIYNAPNLGWSNMPLAETLRAQLAIDTIVVDNDVNVGTWGEACAGAGRGSRDMMGVFIGTGIGAGLVLAGALYHGPRRTAGEIGHTVLQANAPFDQRTLEQLAGRRAIGHRLAKLIHEGHPSVIDTLSDGGANKVKSKMLAEAWEKEDALTRQIVAEAARYVGIAIANAVTLLSLPRVVLGGGVSEALGEAWTSMVHEAFAAHVFPPELQDTEVLTGTLGDDAGVLGAAALARQQSRLDAAPASC